MKRIVSLILVFLMVFASACAEGGLTLIEKTEKNTIKLKKSYPANQIMEGISSTTGLPASGEAYTPIVTVLDNAEDAYPHWGVSQADIIFQIPNAGSGATKLLALFADHYPEGAGGTRSARATMIPLTMAWDAALAHAGGPSVDNKNVDPTKLMSSFGMRSAGKDFNTLGRYAHRVSGINAPHNSSTHILEIHQKLVADGVSFKERPFLFADEPRTDGADAEFIEVIHRGNDEDGRSNSASYATFTYDAATGTYTRTNSSGPYVDRDNQELVTFANVIVLRVPISWNSGYMYLKDHLVGSGVAEIFQNGKYVRGAWFRKSQDDRIVFVGPDGEELPMQRGKSFIVVTNAATDVSYR